MGSWISSKGLDTVDENGSSKKLLTGCGCGRTRPAPGRRRALQRQSRWGTGRPSPLQLAAGGGHVFMFAIEWGRRAHAPHGDLEALGYKTFSTLEPVWDAKLTMVTWLCK